MKKRQPHRNTFFADKKGGVTLLGLETIRMGGEAVRGKAQKAAKNGG
jgi:hypothetical protein